MSEIQPLLVLRVTDLEASVSFYRDKLGFSVEWLDEEMQAARLVAPGGADILLTSDPDLDIASLFRAEKGAESAPEADPVPEKLTLTKGADEEAWESSVSDEIPDALEEAVKGEQDRQAEGLDEADPGPEDEVPAGRAETSEPEELPFPIVELTKEDRIECEGENLLVFQERLAALGVHDMLLEETPGIEQTLLVPDPDGYTVAFRESLRMSDEDVIALYRKGPDLLDGAIMGLREDDLNLLVEEDEWTIRQTVLHMVDFDLEMTQRIKWALAEPGREYKLPLFDPDDWAETLDYANRPIQAEVATFRLIRDHVLTICEHLPDALDRSLVSEQGTVEVRTMMQVVAETAREHIQNILRTRRVYGL
ncbi:hypothetical protein GCM10011571_05940 [Marinithermofilum abyssi]|uniref:VOC domain-containing protein n=1 Tax=Marinithermofilum abyssi TaxID=1571185 RepID=A0A8J2VFC8_9BACL|nr:DinB family protein [Marinithermofilum abyssi]GGE07469.1 hypothetical protein GCM10011571_05940 [Marinithermofilum abyssi]